MAKGREFNPDYAVAPGATLKELLEERGISQSALAVRTGMAEKTISQIVNGIAPITYETAEKFELALGAPANFWNQRELTYRQALARAEATERMEADIAWLDELPVKVLQERGFVDKEAADADLVRLVLHFFGVSSVDAWRDAWGTPIAQYRGGAAKDRRPGYVAAWLRMGDLQAANVETAPFDADEFRRALADVRGMTTLPAAKWFKEVPVRCAPAGVAVVFTKEIASAAVSGATRWPNKDKALIQLSLKFKSADQVWFTFFHEAGHILLHSKKQQFIEFGITDETEEEREANEFASDWLIPPGHAGRLPYLKTSARVIEFAHAIGIDPGIVAGRLVHDELVHPGAFRNLRRKLTWRT
jgi:plasmid maintenance system antidote protein VapI